MLRYRSVIAPTIKGISEHLQEERFNFGIGRGRVGRAGHREERCYLVGERSHHEILREDLIRRRYELTKAFLSEPRITHRRRSSSRNVGAIRAHRVAGISIRSHSASPFCHALKKWPRFPIGVEMSIRWPPDTASMGRTA